MKKVLTGILLAGLLTIGAPMAAAATITFDVAVSTAPLIGNPAGPFWLDFQLNGAGPNTASITNFLFGGGSAVAGTEVLIGGATGNLTAGVGLNDTATFSNEFYQRFNPGTSLRFTVSLSTTLTATPDAFSFTILDGNQLNIPTTGLGDSLLLVNIAPNLKPADLQGFKGTALNGTDYSGVAATAVPEPASAALLFSGLAGLAATRRFRRHSARP